MVEGRVVDGESGSDEDEELACVKQGESERDWFVEALGSESGSCFQRQGDMYRNLWCSKMVKQR